jgi:hypothetical protein
MAEYDDPELERLVRGSLDTHAGEVDTTVPVAARARAAARPRRGRWIAAGAAVAVAAAIAAVTVPVLVVDHQEPTNDVQPLTGQPSFGRTEYWRGVQVDVPAGWGWGTAPASVGGGNDDGLYLCGGPGAVLLPDGHREVHADPTRPYVGRPIMLSDACTGGTPLRNPQAPYVWLGADLPPGTSDVGNRYTQETVEVGGTTVTVGTDDATLRDRILASASATTGPCAPELHAPPVVAVTEDGDQKQPDSLTVCAYRSEEDGTYSLVYGDVLGAAAAAATEDLVAAGPVITGDCLSPQGGEWVTLSADGDGWSREYVIDLNCPAVTDSLGQMHRLEPAMVRPWAVDGLPVTLYGPMFRFFIGTLG